MAGRLNVMRILVGGLLLTGASGVAAQAAEQAGVLECHISGTGVRVLVENQAVDCVYEDVAEDAKPAHYIGNLTKVGANVSVNGPGEMVWGVLAESRTLAPDELSGAYVGPEASVKLGVGGGGAILVGGSNNAISLQPFSFESGTGVGITAGAERLLLSYVQDTPAPPIKHKRHAIAHHHLFEAIRHANEAVEEGRQGHAEALVKHAEAALDHAKAAEKTVASPHTKEGVAHLKAAIAEGKKKDAAAATKHVEEALTYLEAATK